MDTTYQKDKIRFNLAWKQVGDCHLWKNYLDRDGYGSFYFQKKNRRAQRVAYYFANGDIPEGMVIDHICKNRHCVNPEHLRCITTSQNSLENSRSVGAINRMKEFCKYGHKLDRKYGKQRYCSICQSEKHKRLSQKWRAEANLIKC
jgi:hypothetical protein